MKKKIIQIGSVIAALLMLAPLYIIINSDNFSQTHFLILLICSILYDVYMYNEIEKNNYIENAEKRYYDFIKPNNGINNNFSIKERLENTFKFIEELFSKIKSD